MAEYRNDNRHTERRTYRPPLQIFPAGMSTIDKTKAIAFWLVVLCVVAIVIFKATDSWVKTIISSLGFVFILLVKGLFGMNSDNNDDED